MSAVNEAEELAEAQLIAYNKKDTETFCKYFRYPIEIYDFPQPEPERLTESEFQEKYGSYFARESEALCTITQRMSVGKYAIDREVVTGLSHGKTVDCIAIYEVENRLISRIWFIRPAS